MRILAIDTTTKFLTLAIYDNGRVAEYNLETGNKLSSLLVPTIKRALEALGLNPGDIDYFAAGIGPGSFTGIRLGLSAIKGFSLALDKPIIGVATLDALAMNAPLSDKKIITAIDAKRGLVYSCVYKYKDGKLTKTIPYSLLTKNEFYRNIKPLSIIFGDALNLYRDDIKKNSGEVLFLDKDCWYPKAHNIITLALKEIRLGRPGDSFKINPIYLYPKECQIRKPAINQKGF
jgi:tRNA threonylcarbamoyladenosine biosynthesis protein TsaB